MTLVEKGKIFTTIKHTYLHLNAKLIAPHQLVLVWGMKKDFSNEIKGDQNVYHSFVPSVDYCWDARYYSVCTAGRTGINSPANRYCYSCADRYADPNHRANGDPSAD